MKHTFLCALAMATCLLAPPTHAQLQWLGPIPPASKPAATPKPPGAPPSALKPATRTIKRTQRQIGDGDDVLLAKHKGLPLELVIKDGQAKVCQLTRTLVTVCAVIEAPLPPGTTVKLWNLPDGTFALSYMRTAGVRGAPDPDGKAAVRFQAAFNGAARAVLTRTRASARAPNATAEMACIDEDCNDVLGGDGDGGGGGGDSGGGGGGGSISGGESGGIAEVQVHGTPEPEAKIPQVIVTGHWDPEPQTDFDPSVIPTLPPPDRQDALAELTNPCVISPIATVCVTGKRPPLGIDEPPLPTGKPPVFPQWICNFAKPFCTQGQIQRDNNPPDGDPPYNPSWPKRPQYQQCMRGANDKLQECKYMLHIYPIETINECMRTVTDMIEDCHTLYGPHA